MNNRKQTILRTTVSPEIEQAVNEELEKTGETVSEFLRRAILQTLGKKKLAKTVQIGRPRKDDGQ